MSESPGAQDIAGRKIDACLSSVTASIQREEFKRLGVLGDWQNPYRTIDPQYEAVEVRELGKMIAAGLLYRQKKPVYWCASCVTALAEAEVEYEDHTSASIYVKFAVKDGKVLATGASVSGHIGQRSRRNGNGIVGIVREFAIGK